MSVIFGFGYFKTFGHQVLQSIGKIMEKKLGYRIKQNFSHNLSVVFRLGKSIFFVIKGQKKEQKFEKIVEYITSRPNFVLMQCYSQIQSVPKDTDYTFGNDLVANNKKCHISDPKMTCRRITTTIINTLSQMLL